MIGKAILKAIAALLVTAAAVTFAAPATHAQQAVTVNIAIKNHRFQPAEVKAPANKPLLLRVRNLDATPMEFESVTLRVEKVVAGNGEGTIRVRPLPPGRYKFFDDFNQSTGQGALIVE